MCSRSGRIATAATPKTGYAFSPTLPHRLQSYTKLSAAIIQQYSLDSLTISAESWNQSMALSVVEAFPSYNVLLSLWTTTDATPGSAGSDLELFAMNDE